MIQAPFRAYQGDEPFIFISYSHRDADVVYPIISDLHEQGFPIWFDEGISPGVRWSDSLADAINRCSVFLLFITPQAVSSGHCLNETEFALSRDKPFLAVHLEPTELPAGLQLSIGSHQAILRHRLEAQLFRTQLAATLSALLGSTLVTPTHGPAPYQATGNTAAAPGRDPRRFVPALTVLLLAALGVGGWYLISSTASPDQQHALLDSPGDAADPGNVMISGNRLAILSLYAGDGPYSALTADLTNSLIRSLDQLNELEVLAPDAPVSSRVSAGWLLALSVLAAEADRPRVYIELIDVEKNARKHSYALDLDNGNLESSTAPVWQQIGSDLRQLLSGRQSREMNEAWTYYFQGREQQRLPPSRVTLTRARDFFDQAIGKDPEFARAYAGLCEVGLAEIRMNEDWEALSDNAVIEPCRRAVALDDSAWEAQLAIGSYYRLNGQEALAIEHFAAAQALEPNEPAIDAEWAKALAQLGSTEAEQRFQTAINKGNSFWGGYLDLANFYFDTGRLVEARQILEQNKNLFPDLRLWLISSGAINFLLDDWQSAEADFAAIYRLEQSSAANPQSYDRSSWQSRVYLGTIDYYRGCYRSAANFQREAITIQGDRATADAYNRFAEACSALAASSDNDSARQTAIAALDVAISKETVQQALEEFNADGWNNEAWRSFADAGLYSAHRYDCLASPQQPECETARRIAQRLMATAQGNANAEVYYFAALLFTRTGSFDEAKSAVSLAAENGYSTTILINDPILTSAGTNQVNALDHLPRLQKNCPVLDVDPCVSIEIGSNSR